MYTREINNLPSSMQYCTVRSLNRALFTRIFLRPIIASSSIAKQTVKMVKGNETKVINFAPGPAKLPQEVMYKSLKSWMIRYVC
jgi:hypothetical protein